MRRTKAEAVIIQAVSPEFMSAVDREGQDVMLVLDIGEAMRGERKQGG